jgi:hypothetical protein
MLASDAADRLLARAAELDAAHRDGATIAELRAAAAEAGISALGFDAALTELHSPERAQVLSSRRPRRKLRLWAAAIGLAGLVAAGALAVTRERTTPGAFSQAATVEEAFLLHCLSPTDAAELIRPLITDRSTHVVIAPAHAPHVLTVRATRARLQQVRALLERSDGAGAPACARGPSGVPPGGA